MTGLAADDKLTTVAAFDAEDGSEIQRLLEDYLAAANTALIRSNEAEFAGLKERLGQTTASDELIERIVARVRVQRWAIACTNASTSVRILAGPASIDGLLERLGMRDGVSLVAEELTTLKLATGGGHETGERLEHIFTVSRASGSWQIIGDLRKDIGCLHESPSGAMPVPDSLRVQPEAPTTTARP